MDTEPFKTTLKRVRGLSGLSQPKFAQLLGIPVDSIQNWEQERTTPSRFARTQLLAMLDAIENEATAQDTASGQSAAAPSP